VFDWWRHLRKHIGTKLAQKTPSHTSAINKVSYHFNIPISNQIFFNSIEVEFCLEDVWLVTGDNGGGRLLRVDDFSEPACYSRGSLSPSCSIRRGLDGSILTHRHEESVSVGGCFEETIRVRVLIGSFGPSPSRPIVKKIPFP